MPEEQKPLHEQVLETIQKGEVHMKPRWQFVLRAVLIALGVVVAFAALSFLISFFLFTQRGAGQIFADPNCQPVGPLVPWPLILLLIAFLILLDWALQHTKLVSRRPLVVSLVGIVIVVLIGGWAIDHLAVNERFSRYALRQHMPMMEPMYRNYGPARLRRLPAGCPPLPTDFDDKLGL